MFVSPIIYPSSFVPQRFRWLLLLNPLTGIIDNFRAALFVSRPINWNSLGIATAITVAVLVYSVFVFKRIERSFADIV
jgi:lipopolysaccharide transport system permease protein